MACRRLLVVCGCLRSFFSGLWSFVVVVCFSNYVFKSIFRTQSNKYDEMFAEKDLF